MQAPQNANLTDSKEDLEYAALAAVAARKNYKRSMTALAKSKGPSMTPFSNSARILMPDVSNTTNKSTPASIAAAHLPALIACPILHDLISFMRDDFIKLGEYSSIKASPGSLLFCNPAVSLPFVIGNMLIGDMYRFADEVTAINPAVTESQILDLWKFMNNSKDTV